MENVKKLKIKKTRGFSLMELLVVMAIMAILSTMAMTGYFTAVRSMARRRAVSNLMASLTQARQRACIDGARTVLVCYNVKTEANSSDLKTILPTYVVCKALGRVTCIDPKLGQGGKGTVLFGDEFTPLDAIFGTGSSTVAFGSRRLYNLSRTGWTDVAVTVQPGAYSDELISGISGENFQMPQLLWCFTKAQNGVDSAGWQVGDLYGIDVSPPGIFPKNVYFGDLQTSSTRQINVMFYPDGRAKPTSIEIKDQAGKKIATITVEATGNITGGDKVELK